MSRLQYSRLCCLVHDSLHPFSEKSAVSVTKQQEKELLISLSQVMNSVKIWIGDLNSDDDEDDHDSPTVNSAGKTQCTTMSSMCHSVASQCIFKIISELVFLLAIQSRYVQHLAGNVLVAISEFVAASESYWDDFIEALCFYLELAICKLLSHSLDLPIKPKRLDCDSSTFKLDIQGILNSVSWYSVGGIILVLRNILKQLKHDHDVQLLEVYLSSVGSCLSNIPWDSCNGIFIDHTGDVSKGFYGDVLVNNEVGHPKSWIEFCGYLVQLFCSVVSQGNSLKPVADSLDKYPAIHEIFYIIPNILAWCVGKKANCSNDTCMSQYIQHKILVLMIKLSSLVHLDCKMAHSWLHLIYEYFQTFLFESVTQLEAGEVDCLEDSPFLQCLPDVQNNRTTQRHLQRLAVFLYLRCCFSLISLGERPKQCLCGDPKACLKKGFTVLYEWLQRHLPSDILVNSDLYSDRCKSFAKSFLQLYMHEDDMLFEVLLQLSYMPFGTEQQITKEWTSQVVEMNIVILLSDIFDPICLFHLFLAELHYDHQVLLDYLISKDTGASCAEYLLRFLRIICDSWNSSGGFSSCKRRKVVMNGPFPHQDSSSSNVESDKIPQMDSPNQRCIQIPFQDATECLLLLKTSVEDLHHKELFPYNPQVLLRRLKRYQELCLGP